MMSEQKLAAEEAENETQKVIKTSAPQSLLDTMITERLDKQSKLTRLGEIGRQINTFVIAGTNLFFIIKTKANL